MPLAVPGGRVVANAAAGSATVHATASHRPTNSPIRHITRPPSHQVADGLMLHSRAMSQDDFPTSRDMAAVALVSASLLMTELALTRIFSVVMYYHFAFLAISIALFGLSASGVFAYVARRRLDRYRTSALLAVQSAIYAAGTVVALFALVRLRVGLNYTPRNLALMLLIYPLAAI